MWEPDAPRVVDRSLRGVDLQFIGRGVRPVATGETPTLSFLSVLDIHPELNSELRHLSPHSSSVRRTHERYGVSAHGSRYPGLPVFPSCPPDDVAPTITSPSVEVDLRVPEDPDDRGPGSSPRTKKK